MSHTTGPWEIRKRDVIGFHNAYIILNERFGDENRDLISAAPDMLQTLIKIWNAVENGTVDRDFFKLREDYRNVINKATGAK